MKKQFIYALLCGAMILSTGIFTSCSDDDVDDLKSRVTVLEVAIADLKAQLANAITTGASIISHSENNGVYTLKLSSGSDIIIRAGGGSGGGSNITVEINDNNAIITVDGTEYVLPLGSAVNSLVYSPEYADGIVKLGNEGAKIKLLATPAVSADALKNATFDIAEAHELKTRGGNGLFKVDGEVTLDGDFLVVPVKGLGVEATKSYAAAIFMNIGGTAISSNYFTVEVSDDFSFESEQIGGFELKAAYNPKELANGFNEITVNGVVLLKGITNFKDLFTTYPENGEFVIAYKSQQPDGQAQEKFDILNSSLKKDGSWAFSQRPGTSFNDNEERPGFLFNIVAEDVIKAKIYVVIEDEIANVDFNTFPSGSEAEWGGREFSLDMGAQEINIFSAITNYEESFPIIHGGADDFFKKWESGIISAEEDGDVIWNDGEKLVLGSLGEDYATGSKGIYWFCRGFAIYVPEALATVEDGSKTVYVDTNGKKYDGAEGYGYDFWGAQGYDMNNQFMLNEGRDWGFDITRDGKIKVPESYTGYGLRLAVGASYEYAYGVKRLGASDQFGLYFFNRRLAPEGATMPAPKP